MDKELINKLILVGSVAGAILILYFIMSPYQNCIRGFIDIKTTSERENVWNSGDEAGSIRDPIQKKTYCISRTSW